MATRLIGTYAGILIFSRLEENPVMFVFDGGENGCRGILWRGDEFEIFRACRPADGRVVRNETRIECVLVIT